LREILIWKRSVKARLILGHQEYAGSGNAGKIGSQLYGRRQYEATVVIRVIANYVDAPGGTKQPCSSPCDLELLRPNFELDPEFAGFGGESFELGSDALCNVGGGRAFRSQSSASCCLNV
jgi:hypothetical protein